MSYSLNDMVTYRKARPEDDVAAIARYIHLTDPYIYPTIATTPADADWVSLISDCLQDPANIFHYDHLIVAETEERIIGIACVIPCGQSFDFMEHVTIPPALHSGAEKATIGYFIPLVQENLQLQGYNITNICVDEDFRRKQIGKGLLQFCIDRYGQDGLHLDALKDNIAAVNLYLQMGFSINEERPGFSPDAREVLCVNMTRSKI